MKLILASSSPRRKEILSTLNIPFTIQAADIDETIDINLPLAKEIERLSFEKAKAVFNNNQDAIIIGSDTIVTIDNTILGKPKNEEEAYEMLKKLQDKKHSVITAVTIYSKENIETFSITSDVYFYPMSDEEIKNYIKTKEPMDKAGAYAIQGIASRFIKRIDGDYYAIIGLPIGEVYQRLKHFI